MIQVSSQLATLLESGSYTRADLYTFALTNGATLRWSAFATAVVSGGNTWTPVGVRFLRDKWKVARGLETDSLSVTLSVDPANEPSINGVPLRQAVRAGLFDGARVELDWAYLSGAPRALVGTFQRFLGFVGTAEADRLGAKLSVDSPLKLLDLEVPWKTYGPGCRWTLGDADCGVNLASFAVAGTAAAGATAGAIPTSLANADGAWNLGQVAFTSGANAGLRRAIKSSAQAGGVLALAAPFPFAPAAGDAFTVLPGCDHALPALTDTITIPNGGISVAVAPGAADFADLGVVYASGPNAGQPLIETTGVPGASHYALAADVYTFAAADHGLQVTATYVAGPCAASGTCAKRFANLARFGGTPFIPAPEIAV